MVKQPSKTTEKLQPALKKLSTVFGRTWFKYALVAVLVVVGVSIYMTSRSQLLDHKLIKEASFPVYTPKQAPSGYSIDQDKTKLTDKALNYTFASDMDKPNIVVTVQPQPEGFDMTKLVGSGTVNSSTTPNGTLYDLSTSGGSQYLLSAGDALVFFTSPGDIDKSTINFLAQSLSKQGD